MKTVSDWLCPLCRLPLEEEASRFTCASGHAFDKARSGYVNLLLRPGTHGDDKTMVQARTRFLEQGHYDPLRQALNTLLQKYLPAGKPLLDFGCGEGYYTAFFAQDLPCVYGLDISKAAVDRAAKRHSQAHFAVAGGKSLPFADSALGGIVNIFAPVQKQEFLRVLCDGGIFVIAEPNEKHLWELKAAVYDAPYLNPSPPGGAEGFQTLCRQELEYTFTVTDTESLKALFTMTPYYYKTSVQDKEKLNSLSRLTVTASFVLSVYKK